MLADTGSSARAESAIDESREIIAFWLPSFRPELIWVLEVFVGEVVAELHDRHRCSFFYRKSINKIVAFGWSWKQVCAWTIISCSLFLKQVDVLEILQIFKTVILILYEFLNFLPHFGLNLWISCNGIDHHLSEVRSGISSCDEESIEFLKYLFLSAYCLLLAILCLTFSFGNQKSLNYVGCFSFSIVFIKSSINFNDPFSNELKTPLPVGFHSILNIFLLFS